MRAKAHYIIASYLSQLPQDKNMFTINQIRTAYIQECFNAQRELTSIEFVQALASKNIQVSLMTAMLVSGSFDGLQAVQEETVETEELALVWYLGSRDHRMDDWLT